MVKYMRGEKEKRERRVKRELKKRQGGDLFYEF